MTDPLLDSYWEAVRKERYQPHLRHLSEQLKKRSRRHKMRPRPSRLVWAACAIFAVAIAGFIPVQDAETTGFLIAGRTESRIISETLGALEALPLPQHHNLSVSADTNGTTFALFLPESNLTMVESWTARVERAVAPTDLRIQTMEIVTNRALWTKLLGDLGVTISATGTTRDEIQAQVEQQLEALGSGSAEVEQVTGPDGQNSVRIIIRDLP